MQAATVEVEPVKVPMHTRGEIVRRRLGDLPQPQRARWMAVHSNARQEATANFHIREAGFWTFYPVRMVRVRHARQEEDVLRPYLPRYVFVQIMPRQDWNVINRLPGVSTIVYGTDGPLLIHDKDMASLISLADPDGLIKEPPKPPGLRIVLDIGDHVRVEEGPFSGFTAIVEGLDTGGSLSISIDIFGRPTPVTLPIGWVSRAKVRSP